MSHNHVIEFPNKPKQRPIVCDYAGGRFRLTDEGLTFIGIDKDGTRLPPRWISSPLYVVAKTRDAHSGEWGRLQNIAVPRRCHQFGYLACNGKGAQEVTLEQSIDDLTQLMMEQINYQHTIMKL